MHSPSLAKVKPLSNTQVDRLGERLRSATIADADLELLDAYRRSFTAAYEAVVKVLRDQLGATPTGRPAKSTTSISDKLLRERIRLSQMQDIAGCRVIVESVVLQDEVTAQLVRAFPESRLADRREIPSHGYRAVHVVVQYGGKTVEVQIRTVLEHSWAELSEKLADVVDPSVKYGGGPEIVRTLLAKTSRNIGVTEDLERRFAQLKSRARSEELQELADIESRFAANKHELNLAIQEAITEIRQLAGK
jgi:putative GTP pyrophosphokinase